MARMVIAGGSGGIGSATARRLRARGDDVVLVARDRPKLEQLAADIGAEAFVADVGDPAGLAIFDDIAAAGPVDGFLYAVGTITVKPLGALTAAEFQRDFTVNALGAALVLQRLQAALKAAEAAVVLFSSVAVAQGFSGHASIGMAKGAVEGLAKSLAAEWAPAVRVNCIAPSLTRTPLAAGLTGNAALAKAVADLHALRRLGEPDDIAAMTAFLLSRDASWISGQVIGVDGGRAADQRLASVPRKGDLPTKLCATCGRPFTWRKRWARVWDEVRFCSERCRRARSEAARGEPPSFVHDTDRSMS